MKPINEIYPKLTETFKYGGGIGDYNPLLQSLEYKIVLQVDDADWQGDSRLLLQDGPHKFGLLIFGWGSCSGCDALLACNNAKEIEDLRTQLCNEIIWKDSPEDMYEFIKNRDWDMQYSGRSKEMQDFIARALACLS